MRNAGDLDGQKRQRREPQLIALHGQLANERSNPLDEGAEGNLFMQYKNELEAMTQNQGVSVAPEKTEAKMVIVDVNLSTTVTMPVWAKFRVQVPRSDAANHDVLREACDEQEQGQDVYGFGHYEPQAGQWQFDVPQRKYPLNDVVVDVLTADVCGTFVVGDVEEEDEEKDEE